MWERSVHIPLGGENVVIYQLSSCLKNNVFNRILSIVCAMKFAFMICNRGKAKLMLLCSVRNILWHTAQLGSAVLWGFFGGGVCFCFLFFGFSYAFRVPYN